MIPLLAVLSSAVAAGPSCPTPAQLEQFDGFAAQLAEAESVDVARTMAIKRIDRSARAVQRAQRILPDDPGLAEASAEVEALRDDVLQATTPAGVAAPFNSFDTQTADCHYTGGEVVAIVIGFVLGIIPGVILLVLLC